MTTLVVRRQSRGNDGGAAQLHRRVEPRSPYSHLRHLCHLRILLFALSLGIVLVPADSSHAQDAFPDAIASYSAGPNGGFGANGLPDIVLGPPQGAGMTQGSLDVLALRVRIRAGQPAATKRVRIKVRNADASGELPIRLNAAGCSAIVASIDFDRRTDGLQDGVTVRAGRAKAAIVTLTLASAAVDTPDRREPLSCLLTFTASVDVPGSVDPTPVNNVADLELRLLDLNDVTPPPLKKGD
jgi:hypothetical protein